MSTQALGEFEKDAQGDLICIKSTDVQVNRSLSVAPVHYGRRFHPRTVAVEAPSLVPPA